MCNCWCSLGPIINILKSLFLFLAFLCIIFLLISVYINAVSFPKQTLSRQYPKTRLRSELTSTALISVNREFWRAGSSQVLPPKLFFFPKSDQKLKSSIVHSTLQFSLSYLDHYVCLFSFKWHNLKKFNLLSVHTAVFSSSHPFLWHLACVSVQIFFTELEARH